MKRTLLFVLALAVIPVGVDAQGTALASCADISPSSALEDVRTCAEQGDAGAQYNLGYMYTRGGDLPEDYAEAVRWYRLAAEQGFAPAQNDLGVMYDNGNGVPENDVEAVRWYRLAAEQGVMGAQYNLGYMYARGGGLPEDWSWPRRADGFGLGIQAATRCFSSKLRGDIWPSDECRRWGLYQASMKSKMAMRASA
jgi:TPR repeat protein